MVVINYTRSNIIYHVLAKQPLDANPRSEKESMKRCPQRRLDMLSDELNKQLFVIPDIGAALLPCFARGSMRVDLQPRAVAEDGRSCMASRPAGLAALGDT